MHIRHGPNKFTKNAVRNLSRSQLFANVYHVDPRSLVISSLASATLSEVLPTVASTDLLLQSVLEGSTATVVAAVVDMKSAWEAGRPEIGAGNHPKLIKIAGLWRLTWVYPW